MEQENLTTEESVEKEPAHKSRKWILILLLLLLLLIIAGIGTFVYLRSMPKEQDGPNFAPNASVGALPGKTREEIEAMLNQQITDKMVAFTVNAAPVFDNGKAEGNLMLESPGNNINYIEFVISLDDTGEVIYRSGLLKPNQYIDKDKLLVDLDAGEYACTVDITLYDPETLDAKGMSQAGITVTVLN